MFTIPPPVGSDLLNLPPVTRPACRDTPSEVSFMFKGAVEDPAYSDIFTVSNTADQASHSPKSTIPTTTSSDSRQGLHLAGKHNNPRSAVRPPVAQRDEPFQRIIRVARVELENPRHLDGQWLLVVVQLTRCSTHTFWLPNDFVQAGREGIFILVFGLTSRLKVPSQGRSEASFFDPFVGQCGPYLFFFWSQESNPINMTSISAKPHPTCSNHFVEASERVVSMRQESA